MLNRKNIYATKELNKMICLISLFLFLSIPAKAQNQGYNYYGNYQNPNPFVSLTTSFINPYQVPSNQYAYGARPFPYNGTYYTNQGYYNSYPSSSSKKHPFLSFAASLATSYYKNSSSNPNYAYNSNYSNPSIVTPQTSVNGYILPNTGFYPNGNTTINNNGW
jgi:hypothetical protein